MKSLLTFPKGGVHPPEAKSQTAGLPIEIMPVPDELEIILGQHIGAPCSPTVKKRDAVTEGFVIGEVRKGFGAPLHSPVTGVVKDIGMSAHPMSVKAPSITITVDHDAAPIKYSKNYWSSLGAADLLGMVRDAGIIGLGGAGFPTHVKLKPPADVKIDILLLNGAECEPYISADHRVMLDRAGDVVEGAKIIMKILGVKECIIGIEDNKPDAIRIMTAAAAASSANGCTIRVQGLKVKYPQGAERQLIHALTGRRVPSMSLPSAVGVVVHNVATAGAIYDAVVYGKPLYEKVVTIAGGGISRPANLLVKVGTKLRDIVAYLGGVKPGLAKIIIGGPMMGFAVSNLDVPITKTTSAVLFLTEQEVDTRPHSQCIRCGWCLDVCPMGLEPKEIGAYVEANRAQDTAQFGVFDCFECGSCAYICPAKRPLVQLIRLAKMKAKR